MIAKLAGYTYMLLQEFDIIKHNIGVQVYRLINISLKGGAIEDILNEVEKRFDINLSSIRSMGCLNLPHHHIVIRNRHHAPVTPDELLAIVVAWPLCHNVEL